jgi:hypothetical protein
MKAATVVSSVNTAIRHPHVFFRPVRYLWLFSHMRSRSTLLSHILGSHSEIAGYRERHTSYRSNLDLLRMRYRMWSELQWKSSSYLLDKLLHNDQQVDFSLFKSGQYKCIFFIRTPESTIKSIVSMGRKRGRSDYGDVTWAVRYYYQRVIAMIALASSIPARNRYCFDADDFISDSKDKLLTEISSFLSLDVPLSENYQLFETTGQTAHGDPSKFIQSGRVVQPDGSRYDGIQVPVEELARVDGIYKEACVVFGLESPS